MPSDIWAKWLDETEREGASIDRQLHILRSQVRDRVVHKAGLALGSRVVDLGCGLGFLSLEAARIVGPQGLVYAVDSSPGALRELAGRAEEKGLSSLRTLQADISRLPLEDGAVDAVVARSVLSYVPDRPAVLREAARVLRPGGAISIFEPVLSEEELTMDWGDDSYLWRKLTGILARQHPAYDFGRADMVELVREAGFVEVDSFTWHADVTRRYSGEEEALEELTGSLPGELSLAVCWHRHGASGDEILRVARRLAAQSAKPSYRDILPCVYIWGFKQ
ncbi:MAG: methyltransferase domain-containing protein [Actinomycetota bacterium]